MSLWNKSKVISQLWIKSVRLRFASPVSSHLKNIMTYRVVSIESGVHRLRAKDLYLNRAREETVFCEKINSYKLFYPHTHISTATNVFFPIILFFFFFSHNPWSNSWSLSKLSFLLGRPCICFVFAKSWISGRFQFHQRIWLSSWWVSHTAYISETRNQHPLI